MLDWQVFRARLPLKMEFILFISFIPADAWFSIGCVKAVQYMLCVAGMSCTSLGVFALFFFFEVAKYRRFKCSAKLCRHEVCL